MEKNEKLTIKLFTSRKTLEIDGNSTTKRQWANKKIENSTTALLKTSSNNNVTETQ